MTRAQVQEQHTDRDHPRHQHSREEPQAPAGRAHEWEGSLAGSNGSLYDDRLQEHQPLGPSLRNIKTRAFSQGSFIITSNNAVNIVMGQ